METIYVVVVGAGIGTILRYILPGRETYGILLLPALGAAVTAAIWVGLLWLGLTFDGGWIWVASLGGAALICTAVALLLSRSRLNADAHELHLLVSGAK